MRPEIARPPRRRGAAAFILSLLFLAAPGGASEISLAAGPLFELNFYGQPGVRVTASHGLLLNRHPQAMLSYTSSRLSFWKGKHALIIDDILLNAAWHFRPQKLLDPFAGIDIGFLRFNRDNDALFALVKNKFARLNIRAGLKASLLEGRLEPSLEAGYVLIDTSVTFPLFLGVAVCYEIVKGGRP
jgi:hypothetical protein